MEERFDLIVIGSGPGGYVAAIRAAQLGLKTACVEKSPVLGGTCLNVGCIPSKALLHSSELYWKCKTLPPTEGIFFPECTFDFSQIMKRKAEIVTSFNQGIQALFQKNKITRFTGNAQLLTPNTLRCGEHTLQTTSILLATGSEPIPLPFLPFDETTTLSSTGALQLKQVPKKMIVIGAGVIGVELGSVYARLGTEVTFIEFLPRICPTLDEALSSELQKLLEAQGMRFFLNAKVTAAKSTSQGIEVTWQKESGSEKIEANVALVCIGRRPYTKDLGLERLSIKTDGKGFIPVDATFRTSIPSIFAIGDLIDGPMLAHKASEEGVAVAEILAGLHPKISYIAIPNVIYTHPEVAAVGLTEKEVKEAHLDYRVGTFSFKTNSRAQCTKETDGFVKILAEKHTSRLLGVHIIGAHASELINEGALLLQKRGTFLDLVHTPHAHPTLSEALKEAALALDKRPIHK